MNQKLEFFAILTKTGRPVYSKCLKSENTFCGELIDNNEVRGNFISAIGAISAIKSSNEKIRLIKLIKNDFLFSTTEDKEFYFVTIMEKDSYNDDSKIKITEFLISIIEDFNDKRKGELIKIDWKDITNDEMAVIGDIVEKLLINSWYNYIGETSSSKLVLNVHNNDCKLDLSNSYEARQARYWDTIRTIYSLL